MSSSFPRDGRNSTLSSEGSPHEALQSGHGGGGGAGLRDGSVVDKGTDSRQRRIILAENGADIKILCNVQLVSHKSKPPQNSRRTCAPSVRLPHNLK